MTTPSVAVSAFGPLRVTVGGDRQEITQRRERNVLAVLVAQRSAAVSADRLVAEVWGIKAPAQALGSLQVAVARLRKILEPGRPARAPATVLVSSAGGYRLDLPEPDVDVWDFDRRATAVIAAVGGASEGPDEPRMRLEMATAARSVWLGEPYPDCDPESVLREADRLTGLYLVVEEIRAQALLDLGQAGRAASELAELLPGNPYRERLWALAALAHYRCSRQDQALDTLRELRRRLADDLGIDPAPETAAMERAILAQDPALRAFGDGSDRSRVTAPSDTADAADRHGATADPPTFPSPAPVTETARHAETGEPSIGSIGRDAALNTVRALVGGLGSRSEAGFLVISGEPGIGKSRLVQDLAELAKADGALALVGRCHADFAPALWPWLPVVRTLAGDRAKADPADPLTPVLAGSTALNDRVDTEAGGLLRLFDAVGMLLSGMATERPLVVVLEDLHWADATSLRLLAHLATTGVAGTVLVVATIRTGEGEPSSALTAAMAAMSRASASRIRLGGLSPTSVGVLLRQLLDDHDSRLDLMVARATGGNPFFVLEYARLLEVRDDLTADRFDPHDLPVPDGVTDVLQQRIGRLPSDALATLRTAALIGTTIDPDVIREVTGTSIADTLDHLDLALASGILTERPPGYAFSHSLTRDVLAAQWSAGRRIRMHDAIARVLLAQGADDPDRAAEIAHHAYQAAALGPEQSDRAVEALERAARVAEARQAFDESLALWRRASQTISGADAALRRLPARLGEARSLFRLARHAQGREVVTEVVTSAAAAGRWASVAQGATILNRAGVWTWREHGVPDERLIAALESALDWVDAPTGARLLAALQIEYSHAGVSDLADERGDRAVHLARSTGNETLLAEVLLAGTMAAYGPGTVVARLARTEELVALPLRGELMAYANFVHARTLFAAGRVDDADAAAARCQAALSDLRHTGIEIPLLGWRLARARDRDDHEAAAQVLVELRVHSDRGVLTGTGVDLLYALRTRVDGPFPDDLLDFARRVGGGMRALVCFEAMEAGRLDAALELIGDPPAPDAADYSVLATHCLRVAVLASGGPGEAFDADLEFLSAHSGSVVTYGTIEHLGAVDYFLALGELMRGNPDRAAGYLDDATELLQRMDIRPWLRRAQTLKSRIVEFRPTG